MSSSFEMTFQPLHSVVLRVSFICLWLEGSSVGQMFPCQEHNALETALSKKYKYFLFSLIEPTSVTCSSLEQWPFLEEFGMVILLNLISIIF